MKFENKIDFQFGYDSEQVTFNFPKEDKENLNNLFIIINLNKDFYFEKSKMIIKSETENKIIINTRENINEEEKISINNWIYIIC